MGEVGGIPGSSAATVVITPTTTQAAPDASARPDSAQATPHGDTLTISAGTDPSGTSEYTGVTTVVLTSATQYDGGRDSSGTIGKSSIKVGSYVIVEGSLSSDGKTMSATSLGVNSGSPVAGR